MADRKEGYDAVIASPVGRLGIRADAALTGIDFVSARTPLHAPGTPLARQVCRQLRAYFQNPRTRFRLPLALRGTVFQQQVWRRLARIPAGSVRSYGELASAMRSAARAVGGACRANPVPIVIPCHRVVSASGLGGFMGHTRGVAMDIKRWLLAHEHVR